MCDCILIGVLTTLSALSTFIFGVFLNILCVPIFVAVFLFIMLPYYIVQEIYRPNNLSHHEPLL